MSLQKNNSRLTRTVSASILEGAIQIPSSSTGTYIVVQRRSLVHPRPHPCRQLAYFDVLSPPPASKKLSLCRSATFQERSRVRGVAPRPSEASAEREAPEEVRRPVLVDKDGRVDLCCIAPRPSGCGEVARSRTHIKTLSDLAATYPLNSSRHCEFSANEFKTSFAITPTLRVLNRLAEFPLQCWL